MVSSSQSLANFTHFLESMKQQRVAAPAEPSREPVQVILRSLQAGMVPVSSLVEATRLQPEVILEAVERLRALDQVEVVETSEGHGRKFIRLTPAGYAAAAAA